MLKYLIPATILAFSASGQVSQYIPPSLTSLGALNPKSGSAGAVLSAAATIVPGSGSSSEGSPSYSGPARPSVTLFAGTGFRVTIGQGDIIGNYRLDSISFYNVVPQQTIYRRDGTIQHVGYDATGLPTTHSLNFAALDFSIVAPTMPPPVTPPPAPVAVSITAQPTNVRATAGQSASFSVAASSQTPLSVQWRKNGIPIPGATGERLTLPSVTPSDAGTYDVVLSNAAGPVISTSATLTVDAGRVKNISVRIVVADGGLLIAGFVLDAPKAVLVRGIGRSLEQFGVPAGTTMPNPSIEVFSAAGVVVAQNDDYVASAALTATTTRVGAFGLSSTQDAALSVTLPAGAYTVQLRPAGGRGGDALVEVYDAD